MNSNVIVWLMGRDTGLSSRTIVAFMERNELAMAMNQGAYHPLDPSDLGRCIRLLDIEPSYRERIHEMAVLSPVWARLATHWAELETLYREEEPTGRAPKCYTRMHELIYGVTPQHVP